MKPVTIALSGLIDVFQPTPKPTFQLIHKKFFFGGVGDIEWTIRDTKMYYLSKKCIISPSGPPEATVINRTFVKRRADFLDMPP